MATYLNESHEAQRCVVTLLLVDFESLNILFEATQANKHSSLIDIVCKACALLT